MHVHAEFGPRCAGDMGSWAIRQFRWRVGGGVKKACNSNETLMGGQAAIPVLVSNAGNQNQKPGLRSGKRHGAMETLRGALLRRFPAVSFSFRQVSWN